MIIWPVLHVAAQITRTIILERYARVLHPPGTTVFTIQPYVRM